MMVGREPESLIDRVKERIADGTVAARQASITGNEIGKISSGETQAIIIVLQELISGARCLEIGTFFASTARVMAEAAARTGGHVVTIDPYGGHRIPDIVSSWPAPMQAVTEFHAQNSMSYFADLADRGVSVGAQAPFDIVYVDGKHDFEYAIFDVLCSAKYMRPGGVILIDNIDQSGPYDAARYFLDRYTLWTPLVDPEAGESLEGLKGANSAMIFAPPGVELGAQILKLEIRDLKISQISKMNIPVRQTIGRGVLTTVNNLCFFSDNCHITGQEPITKVVREQTSVGDGEKSVNIVFDPPLTIELPDMPGSIRLELELFYKADEGKNLLLDVDREIQLA